MLVFLPEDGNANPKNVPAHDKDAHNESHLVEEPECSQLPAPSSVTITRYGRTSRPADILA